MCEYEMMWFLFVKHDLYIYICTVYMSVISVNIWGHTSIHSITAINSRSKRDQLRCVSLTNFQQYRCHHGSVQRRSRELFTAGPLHIHIHCLFPMTPNQESSGSMPTSSEPVRVPVRLPLPVANLEVSDSILNIYIIYIRFHSKCSVLRIFYHHSRLKMLDWYK